MGKNKNKLPKRPFISVCTPTYNRRPFIPIIIKCFEHQTYPKDKIEWIIVDDGTDKIEDLVCNIPQVKYFKYDEKLTLGKKRNIMNEKASGDIIVYMDDDDYYPPERIQHAVDKLRDSKALCAGTSAMFLYFKHINKMYQFGPYGPNHSTAASFAFKRELLNTTRFDETSCIAEEKHFLKQYKVPFVQLDAKKTILVFSHNHNSFDKKQLLDDLPNPYVHDTPVLPHDIVKEPEILKFFMQDIDALLDNYEPGKPQYKEDVNKQIIEIRDDRQKTMETHMKQQQDYQDTINKIMFLSNPQACQQRIDEQTVIIQQLTHENMQLKEKVDYLNGKIKELISIQIQHRNGKQNNLPL